MQEKNDSQDYIIAYFHGKETLILKKDFPDFYIKNTTQPQELIFVESTVE